MLTHYSLIWYIIKASQHNSGGLAQLGEQLPYKQWVRGSSPLTSTIIYADLAQLAEQLICNQ